MLALIVVVVSIVALLVIYTIIASDHREAKQAQANSTDIVFDGVHMNEAYFRYHEQTYGADEGML